MTGTVRYISSSCLNRSTVRAQHHAASPAFNSGTRNYRADRHRSWCVLLHSPCTEMCDLHKLQLCCTLAESVVEHELRRCPYRAIFNSIYGVSAKRGRQLSPQLDTVSIDTSFTPESILSIRETADSKPQKEVFEGLVCWKGFRKSQSTWESGSSLINTDMESSFIR